MWWYWVVRSPPIAAINAALSEKGMAPFVRLAFVLPGTDAIVLTGADFPERNFRNASPTLRRPSQTGHIFWR